MSYHNLSGLGKFSVSRAVSAFTGGASKSPFARVMAAIKAPVVLAAKVATVPMAAVQKAVPAPMKALVPVIPAKAITNPFAAIKAVAAPIKAATKMALMPAKMLPAKFKAPIRMIARGALMPATLLPQAMQAKLPGLAPKPAAEEYAAVQAGDGVEYQDANGNPITKAQYDALVAQSQQQTYQDAYGNPITKEQYDALMAQQSTPEYAAVQPDPVPYDYEAGHAPAQAMQYSSYATEPWYGEDVPATEYDREMMKNDEGVYEAASESELDASDAEVSQDEYAYDEPMAPDDDAAYNINDAPEPVEGGDGRYLDPMNQGAEEVAEMLEPDNTFGLEGLRRRDRAPMDYYAAIPGKGRTGSEHRATRQGKAPGFRRRALGEADFSAVPSLGAWNIMQTVRNPKRLIRGKTIMRSAKQAAPYALVAGAAAATIVTGGAAAPLLVGAGVALASQAAKDVAKDRAKKAQEAQEAEWARQDAQEQKAIRNSMNNAGVVDAPSNAGYESEAAPGELPEGDYSGEYNGDGVVADWFNIDSILG